MSVLLYNIFLFLYRLGISMYALFNQKAKKWVDGRRQWKQMLEQTLVPGEKRVWMHCSSLGEFEQGRPLIEALKQIYPQYTIVITFFSPSGYEMRKDYVNADYVFYLPMDGKRNGKEFIALINPALVLFIKYEFWYYYLRELHSLNIPVILVSAAFRKEQAFFSWYGSFFRKLLHCFNWIFVQDEASANLLQEIGMEQQVSISGDTRYDRVAAIAEKKMSIPIAAEFKGNGQFIIAGSTWPGDEKMLKGCTGNLPAGWKIVIAPHEIDDLHLRFLQKLFGSEAILYSSLKKGESGFGKKIMIVDNIGLLSALYAYGEIAYIGGGFQKGGIHNILEPAAFGLPVIFGPIYHKFVEANTLVAQEYAFPVKGMDDCRTILLQLIQDNHYRVNIQQSLLRYMQQQKGATAAILDRLEQEKWLEAS